MNETVTQDNPMGTDGFEFVEFTGPDPAALRDLFERMGFPVVARHRRRDITLHCQGDIILLVHGEAEGFAADFARAHGPSACGMGFRVADADKAYARALSLGAQGDEADDRSLSRPAIRGIGGSRLYLVDGYGPNLAAWMDEYEMLPDADAQMEKWGGGLRYIDHLTHNVRFGNMDEWYDFYRRLFNFHEIRYFDIKGRLTGLVSRALASPDGRIMIPINESEDPKSQINEYIEEYRGEGIQHVALGTSDIYATVDKLTANGLEFQFTPDTYYEKVDERVAGHEEKVEELRRRRILIDGSREDGFLLQIFTKNVIGPIFFEIIQRKDNKGFGEGNFQALFESIEEDQIRRGYLKPEEVKA